MSDLSRTADDEREPFEAYAWRINQGLHEWTAKVDAKASVVLSLETAVLGIVLLFAGSGKPLGELSGPAVWVFRVGVSLLAAAIVIAGAAIFPQLNRREAKRRWRQNYVYFGHLRHWEPAALIAALDNDGPARTRMVLATQLIALSKIIWRKHTLLQCSMSLVAAGNLAIWAAALMD